MARILNKIVSLCVEWSKTTTADNDRHVHEAKAWISFNIDR